MPRLDLRILLNFQGLTVHQRRRRVAKLAQPEASVCEAVRLGQEEKQIPRSQGPRRALRALGSVGGDTTWIVIRSSVAIVPLQKSCDAVSYATSTHLLARRVPVLAREMDF